MDNFLKRTWARVDLSAIRHNYKAIAEFVGRDCAVMAIVKADGYGHGAAAVSRELRDAGAPFFGVSNLEEALELRRCGIEEPVLILGYTPTGEARRLAEYGIAQTVFDSGYGRALSREAASAGVTVAVHIKLDTGMSRLGLPAGREAAGEAAALCALPGLRPEGLFTHFASADESPEDGAGDGDAFTRGQFERFLGVERELAARDISFRYRHCCNSAATLRYPEMHLDMVRPGLILYGLYPAPWMRDTLELIPAMELKTVVAMVKTVPAGTTVSYGRQFTAARETVLATVPVGYADGYPRLLSNRADMLVGGRRARLAGRVCMDQCVLDVTGIEGVREGMEVTAFGRDGEAEIPVEEFAEWSGTIHYETICGIGKRVPRVYHG